MAQILIFMSLAQALIAVVPDVVKLVEQLKALLETMFAGKAITKEQQNALSLYVDAQAALAASGIVPPEYTVEPDPE